MDTMRICPNCRKPLPADVPMGLCPECLMKAGFPTATGATASGFEPPPVEEIARLFPQLEILGLLGKGGMGAVYKARQPALDRYVALKVLPPTVAHDPGFAERFNREARALARLNHPNIVSVHDFGQAGGLNYLLMELVDGANLREMEQAGRLTPQQALAIVPQICEALQFAHGEGIVHRDIKPENILIDKKGRLKITDFGIAKIIGAPSEKVSLTGAGDVMGTPHYMAPEQIEHPQAVDHRADIYSLGVVFYEMLTGELPLGKFQPPSQKVQVDVRLDEVVLRTLEKEPARRYQQASEVKTRVETIASNPGPATAHGLPPVPLAVPSVSDKTILPAFLLALFLGVFGAHRFYIGKMRTALAQLSLVAVFFLFLFAIVVTFGVAAMALSVPIAAIVVACGVWWMIDCILLPCKAFTDGQGRRMTNWINPAPGAVGVPPIPAAIPPLSKPRGPLLTDSRNLIVAPAVALMVAGCLKVFSALKALLFVGATTSIVESVLSNLGVSNPGTVTWWTVFGSIMFKIVPALFAIYGAIEMIQIRSYSWSVAAAILSIIGCSITGLLAGVWALVVLLLPDVRQTFANPAPAVAAAAKRWQLFLGIAAGTSLMLVLLSGLIFGFGPKKFSDSSNRSGILSLLSGFGDIFGSGAFTGDESDFTADDNETNASPNVFPAGAATTFSKSFPSGPNGKLTIKADCGEIRVDASPDNSVNIKVTRKVTRAGNADASRLLAEEHLVVKRDGDDVTIHAVTPASLRHRINWTRPNLDVHYEISVPPAFATQLDTMGGGIQVSHLAGPVNAKTAGGELTFNSVEGPVDGTTMGGGITVDHFTGRHIRASTMGGSISADFAAGPSENCDLHTLGGSVVTKMPAAANITLDAHTMGGTVTSDLPVQIEGRHRDNSIQGRINSGGPVLKLETMGGDIKLLRHE